MTGRVRLAPAGLWGPPRTSAARSAYRLSLLNVTRSRPGQSAVRQEPIVRMAPREPGVWGTPDPGRAPKAWLLLLLRHGAGPCSGTTAFRLLSAVPSRP